MGPDMIFCSARREERISNMPPRIAFSTNLLSFTPTAVPLLAPEVPDPACTVVPIFLVSVWLPIVLPVDDDVLLVVFDASASDSVLIMPLLCESWVLPL